VSYLQRPRLHFAGRFQADVSTVNNDFHHFQPTFQPGPDTGSWNPAGTGAFRLLGCRVTAATYADGSAAGPDDAVTSMTVAHNAGAPPRLVDLDPQQQLVSSVWGLHLRLLSGANEALSGAFAVTAFSDLWNRVPSDRNDFTLAAFFQSVLLGVRWNDAVTSRWLRELRAAAGDGPVSVKFNVDAFDMGPNTPTTATGRIVGTIGPGAVAEPQRFVRGRQLAPVARGGPLNACAAVVDPSARKVVLDLGNALPTAAFNGPIADQGTLELRAGNDVVGRIDYRADGWYERTAGIVELPADGALDDGRLTALAQTPLQLVRLDGQDAVTLLAEAANGMHVRADLSVFRLDAGESAEITLYTTRFGEPAGGVPIACTPDVRGFQGGDELPLGQPPDAVSAAASVTSGPDGVARLTVSTSDPKNPRGYIDGQLYGIRPTVQGANVNRFDFVSILLWNGLAGGAEPTWWDDVHPILHQFAELYPVMAPIVTLDDYASVVANGAAIASVFNLPPDDPRYMPVTRDLSGAKRALILRWLQTTGNAGQPNLGTPPAARELQLAARPNAPEDPNERLGGKTAALLKTPQFTEDERPT
jgi:hypothetical protein